MKKITLSKSKIILLTSLFSISLFTLITCAKREKIQIDGSSTVYPLTEAITEDYLKINNKASIVIGISGTGGGFKKFCNGETDVQNASREIEEIEISKCKEKGIDYKVYPIALDGIVVVTNKENNFIESLTVSELKKIFQSDSPVHNWKDINGNWTDQKFKVFTPSQGNGTYDYFVEAILGKKEKMRKDAILSVNPNVLVTGIKGEKNSIGFFSIAYYAANKNELKLISIVNPKTNKAITPNSNTIINNEYFPLSRILYLYVNANSLNKSKILDDYLNYYLKNVDAKSASVGFFPYKK